MSFTIQATEISRSFGAGRILDNLTFAVSPGTVYGLVGLNGAGKTTLLRMLLGLIKSDTGLLTVCGFDPWQQSPAFYRTVGAALESDGFSGNLTPIANLLFYAAARGLTPVQLERYLDEFWKDWLVGASKQKVRYLSRGQKVQCGLCRAFAGFAPLIVLDEPTVAIDMQECDRLLHLVRSARERGCTVVISSHQLDIIEELCDRIGLLEGGHIKEITPGGAAAQFWIIRCDNDARSELERCRGVSGVVPIAEGFEFELDNGIGQIPEIIRTLVEAQVSIREVRPFEKGVKEALRRRAAGALVNGAPEGI